MSSARREDERRCARILRIDDGLHENPASISQLLIVSQLSGVCVCVCVSVRVSVSVCVCVNVHARMRLNVRGVHVSEYQKII